MKWDQPIPDGLTLELPSTKPRTEMKIEVEFWLERGTPTFELRGERPGARKA